MNAADRAELQAPPEAGHRSSDLDVRGVEKRFGAVNALRGASITVPAGRVLAVLGPSGCGKTTLLRAVAGLEAIDAGSIRIGGDVMADGERFVAPERRRLGMVFQDWALFPHMSVAANVAYGLDKAERRSGRAEGVLAMVGLEGYGPRMPNTLSGGQQQRVALARALAPRPRLLLMDEPFSNLDASLRTRVRTEVHRLLVDLGITAVFVTHDQDEAFVLGDEVAVMRDGVVVQQSTPDLLYRRPADPWVAGFVGDANLLAAVAHGDRAPTPWGNAPITPSHTGPVQLLIRPEHLCVSSDPRGTATVRLVEYHGHDAMYHVETAEGPLLRVRSADAGLRRDEAATLRLVPREPLVAFPEA